MTNTIPLTADAAKRLQVFVLAASKAGEISPSGLQRIADWISGERRILDTAAYLEPRKALLRPAERKRLAQIVANREPEDLTAIKRLAEDFYRGDLSQLIAVLDRVALKGHDQDALDRVRTKAVSPFPPADLAPLLEDLRKIADAREIALPPLKPLRIERPERRRIGGAFHTSASN